MQKITTAEIYDDKLVLLIDAMNLFYRSFHARRMLSNSNGEHTGAIYGFIETLYALAQKYKTRRIVVVWDGKKNWRLKQDQQYKANREQDKYEQDVRSAAKLRLMGLLRYCAIVQVMQPYYEADDIVAKLSYLYGRDVGIVSNDKDYSQLVNDKNNIFIVTKARSGYTELRKNDIKKKHDVFPKEFSKFLALAGDTSDNVKGVTNIGKVKAIKIIERIRDGELLQDILNEKQYKEFRAAWKLVRLSKKMTGEIPLSLEHVDTSFAGKFKRKKVQGVLDELEIKKYNAYSIKRVLHMNAFYDQFVRAI